MKYLRRLWSQFYGEPPHNDAAEAMRVELSPTISAEQRKKLLAIVDSYDSHCECVSFESFVAGFSLAINISAELFSSRASGDHPQLRSENGDEYYAS